MKLQQGRNNFTSVLTTITSEWGCHLIALNLTPFAQNLLEKDVRLATHLLLNAVAAQLREVLTLNPVKTKCFVQDPRHNWSAFFLILHSNPRDYNENRLCSLAPT